MTTSPTDTESLADRQLLRSEMLRAGLLVVGMVVMMIVALVLLGRTNGLPMDTVSPFRVMAPFMGLAVYECLVLWWLRWRRTSQGWYRYINTAAEMAVPTAAVLILGNFLGLGQSLTGAGPWLYFVLIILTTLYLDPRLCVAAGVWAAGQFAVLAYFGIQETKTMPGWEVLTFGPAYGMKVACLVLMGVASGFVAWQIRRQLNMAVQAAQERSRAISIFGQHVSPQVAEMLLHQPVKPAGEERTVCVMFFDIRDFSMYAAGHTPAEVMAYLNAIFCELIVAVNKHEGIINKFLGDGFMAVFGAPIDHGDPCGHAMAAAEEILALIERLNAEGKIPETRVGIGLHLGEAITGNVGSAERKEYTVIGDVVNLAARIEQATKQFDARLLVSDAVMEAVEPGRYAAEDLGWVDLKGQSKGTRLYRVSFPDV